MARMCGWVMAVSLGLGLAGCGEDTEYRYVKGETEYVKGDTEYVKGDTEYVYLDGNTAPVLAEIAPQSTGEKQPLEFTVSAQDTGDLVALSAGDLPDGASFDPASGLFRWTPGLGMVGSYDVTFTASDGALDDSRTVTLTVTELPPPARPAETAEIYGLTSFAQSVPAEDGDGEIFPGHANIWDLNSDFSLSDGYDDQFDDAMELIVNGDYFGSSAYADLVFSGPVLTEEDGVRAAVIFDSALTTPFEGDYSILFNGSAGARLQQSIDLSTATHPVTLSWWDSLSLSDWGYSSFSLASPHLSYFRIVLRQPDGTEITELYQGAGAGLHSLVLPTETTGTVILSIEWRSNTSWPAAGILDAVSVTDDNGIQLLTNGGFESGDLANWTLQAGEVQNITSSVQAFSGLDVSRSFYTEPNKLWGRWLDLFENPTSEDISVTLTYETNLGSDDYGIIYYTPGTERKALSAWDGDASDRDLGMVFGTADLVSFASDSGLEQGNGSDDITVGYQLTVPAGGKAAIVQFILMSGKDTGSTATSILDQAEEIDAAALDIVNGFWTQPGYRNGLTDEQIRAIVNF